LKILIVDDDRFRQASLKNFLLTEGILGQHDLYHAENTLDATDLLQRFYFDVMVLDVVLPKDSDKRSVPDSKNALSLLATLMRTSTLKKPSKIIGITSHLSDLGRFQESFRKHCIVIIEANRKSVGWKSHVAEYIGYEHDSKRQKTVHELALHVITVHGIRTFGQWQNRFKNIVNSALPVQFHSYKYGYRSVLALFSRSRHAAAVNALASRFQQIFNENPDCRFAVFSHSFGTYLTIEALRLLLMHSQKLPISTVVLSGSVLENTVDLSFLFDKKIRVINDCANGDYVLWLSEAFVPFLGMAGKTGIFGMENAYLTNRHFPGGHSSYFDGDDFMIRNWLPLINVAEEVKVIDTREDSALEQDFLESIIIFFGSSKRWFVGSFLLLKTLISSVIFPR